MNKEHGEIVIYQAENGQSLLEVHQGKETVWLTQAQMVELFKRDQSVISRHLQNVFKEGELEQESNMQKMHIAGVKEMIGKAKNFCSLALGVLILLPAWGCQEQTASKVGDCQPTPYDEIGPFYRPNAPVRSRVGKGYILKGTVRSVEGCQPLPGAMVEFWLVNEQGEYDEQHRATVIADRKGRYKFESNRPSDYVGRLPHIHIRVSANGHETLITQHYPEKGRSIARFDIILAGQPDPQLQTKEPAVRSR